VTRLVLRGLARWGRALTAPLALLATIVAARAMLPLEVGRLIPGHALSLGWRASLIATVAWLATSAIRVASEPARDDRAARRLQALREGASVDHARLLCIERTLARSPAGQRVVVSDIHDGRTADVWLSETALPTGSFALIGLDHDAAELLDWIGPAETAAARRAEQRQSARRRLREARAARIALERADAAAAEVVRAAEALLRQQ